LSGSPQRKDAPIRDEVERQAVLTWSGREVIRRKDFDQMSTAELAEAEQAVRDLQFAVKPIRTRRARPDRHGPRADPRATLREARRRAGEITRIERKAPRLRHPDLVALCDISGSMSVYSRMLLRYLHAISHATRREWGHVHAFTFGTSLTNVTRALKQSDPDLALAAAGHEARDWEGGTRIGASLERFNKAWSRRVLTSGATVMLITDGLERDDLGLLEREAARLSRSVGRLVWLNPLFRWDGFSPQRGRSAHAPGPCGQLPRLPFARQPSIAVHGAGRGGASRPHAGQGAGGSIGNLPLGDWNRLISGVVQ
jgi:uncharacterized protein with von Willebrand factor type A (vWA) domain